MGVRGWGSRHCIPGLKFLVFTLGASAEGFFSPLFRKIGHWAANFFGNICICIYMYTKYTYIHTPLNWCRNKLFAN